MRTSAEIKAVACKHWDSGRLLGEWLGGEESYPLQIALAPPSSRALLSDYAGVQQWISALEASARSKKSAGYRLEYTDKRLRKLGTQRIPAKAWIESRADCLALAGRADEFTDFAAQIEATYARLPALLEWLHSKPMAGLAVQPVWGQLLTVCEWFTAHPRPDQYLRALDIPGIDTKFIESHQKILDELLRMALPDAAMQETEAPAPRHRFAHRLGLRYDQPGIRLRLLDPALRRHYRSIGDMTLVQSDFQLLDPPCATVFVTENKSNGLAFPDVNDAIVVFGLGHGLGVLKNIPWLTGKRIIYWGDIDTHGFAILSRMRGYYPQTESLLMHERLLARYRELAVDEPTAARSDANWQQLTGNEKVTLAALREHRYGHCLRLEQERIPFSELTAALARLSREN